MINVRVKTENRVKHWRPVPSLSAAAAAGRLTAVLSCRVHGKPLVYRYVKHQCVNGRPPLRVTSVDCCCLYQRDR